MGCFEYKCNKCENVYRIWKHNKPTASQSLCNKCGSSGTPVLGVAHFDFKGGGFYENDYKKGEVALPAEDE